MNYLLELEYLAFNQSCQLLSLCEGGLDWLNGTYNSIILVEQLAKECA